jgi:hypothetical protein
MMTAAKGGNVTSPTKDPSGAGSPRPERARPRTWDAAPPRKALSHHARSAATSMIEDVKVFFLKTGNTIRNPSAMRMSPMTTAGSATRDHPNRRSCAGITIVATKARLASPWMIFWARSFSAAGPACVRCANRAGSVFAGGS